MPSQCYHMPTVSPVSVSVGVSVGVSVSVKVMGRLYLCTMLG